MAANCSSCGAAILWVKTVNGKRMPLDEYPTPDGNVVLVDGVAFSAYTLDALEGRDLYKSHFATCPNSPMHRKPKRAGKEPGGAT